MVKPDQTPCVAMSSTLHAFVRMSRTMRGVCHSQGQADSSHAAGQASSSGNAAAASTAKAGDVSTERRPGSLTNQQVPKNLTDADAAAGKDAVSSFVSTAAGITNVAGKAATTTAVGAATGGAAGGAIAAAGSLDEAIPHARKTDVQQIDVLASTVQNASDTLANVSSLASARQQVERALQDGLDDLNSTVREGWDNVNVNVRNRLDGLNSTVRDTSKQVGKSIKGSAQSAIAQGKSADSPGASQLYLLVGAVFVFGLFMLRRRHRRPHAGQPPSMSLVGPGVSDQGIGGWLRPRSSRHRLAND